MSKLNEALIITFNGNEDFCQDLKKNKTNFSSKKFIMVLDKDELYCFSIFVLFTNMNFRKLVRKSDWSKLCEK